MASDSHWQSIASTDWLQHEWRFHVRELFVTGKASFEVIADGCGLGSHPTLEAAQIWMATARPTCLAEVVAKHPSLHPVEAVIEGGGVGRLGRIRPENWGSYDALKVGRTDGVVTVLSAKARAAFPDQFAVFIRFYHASCRKNAP